MVFLYLKQFCWSELGLFYHNIEKEKLFWIDLLECEDYYYKKLNTLQKNKDKFKLHILQKNKDKYKLHKKKYYQTLDDIRDVQNQLRLDTIKLKVKFKIQSRQIAPHIS